MLDYGADPGGRPAAGAERTAYARNSICKGRSSPVWSFLSGHKNEIHVMRDGILLTATGRRGGPARDIEAHDWQDVTSIDVRQSPVEIHTRIAPRAVECLTRATAANSATP